MRVRRAMLRRAYSDLIVSEAKQWVRRRKRSVPIGDHAQSQLCRYRIPDLQNLTPSGLVALQVAATIPSSAARRRPRLPRPQAGPFFRTRAAILCGRNQPSRRRNMFLTYETRFGRSRHLRETVPIACSGHGKRSLTMSTIIGLIYRTYCRARLAEIHKIGG